MTTHRSRPHFQSAVSPFAAIERAFVGTFTAAAILGAVFLLFCDLH